MAYRDYSRRPRKVLKYLTEKPGPKIQGGLGKEQWADTGAWVTVRSSWCAAIRFEGDGSDNPDQIGVLSVQFDDGAICRYRISRATAQMMFEANSIGKFTREILYHLPYERGY